MWTRMQTPHYKAFFQRNHGRNVKNVAGYFSNKSKYSLSAFMVFPFISLILFAHREAARDHPPCRNSNILAVGRLTLQKLVVLKQVFQ